MNADMLGGVIAETANTHLQQFVDELHIIFLEVGILGVDVGETTCAFQSALITVVVIGDGSKTL